jgi:hypothetical protein
MMPSVSHWVLQILTTFTDYYAHNMLISTAKWAKFTADRVLVLFLTEGNPQRSLK